MDLSIYTALGDGGCQVVSFSSTVYRGTHHKYLRMDKETITIKTGDDKEIKVTRGVLMSRYVQILVARDVC